MLAFDKAGKPVKQYRNPTPATDCGVLRKNGNNELEVNATKQACAMGMCVQKRFQRLSGNRCCSFSGEKTLLREIGLSLEDLSTTARNPPKLACANWR